MQRLIVLLMVTIWSAGSMASDIKPVAPSPDWNVSFTNGPCAADYAAIFPGLGESWAFKYPQASWMDGLDLIDEENPLRLPGIQGGLNALVICRGAQPWILLKEALEPYYSNTKIIPVCDSLYQWSLSIPMPYFNRIRHELQKPWHTIIAGAACTRLPVFLQFDMAQKILDGRGAVLMVESKGAPGILENTLLHLNFQSNTVENIEQASFALTEAGRRHPLTAGYDASRLDGPVTLIRSGLKQADVLLTANGHPVVAVASPGQGRVAAFLWRTEDGGKWLFPFQNKLERREAVLELIGRSAAWVARKDPPYRFEPRRKSDENFHPESLPDSVFSIGTARPACFDLLDDGASIAYSGISREISGWNNIGNTPKGKTSVYLTGRWRTWNSSNQWQAFYGLCPVSQSWGGLLSFKGHDLWSLWNNPQPRVVLLRNDIYDPWALQVLPWWSCFYGADCFFIPCAPGLCQTNGDLGRQGKLFRKATFPLTGALGLAWTTSTEKSVSDFVVVPHPDIAFQQDDTGNTNGVLSPEEARRACHWYIRSLNRVGYECRPVSIPSLESDLASKPRLVIIPACPSLPPTTIDKLRQFVSNGGILIADAGFLEKQPDAFLMLTGLHRRSLRLVNPNSSSPDPGRIQFQTNFRLENEDCLLTPPGWEEEIECREAKVICRHSKLNVPWLTAFDLGKGRTWFINARAGMEQVLIDWGGESLLRAIHSASGLTPAYRFDIASDDAAQIEFAHRMIGENHLFGAVCLPGQRPKNAAFVHLPSPLHVYDCLKGDYLGHTNRIPVDLTATPVSAFSALTFQLNKLHSTVVMTNQELNIAITWDIAGKKPDHLFVGLELQDRNNLVTLGRWSTTGACLTVKTPYVKSTGAMRIVDGLTGIRAAPKTY